MALRRAAGAIDVFLAVTNGPEKSYGSEAGAVRRMPVFPVNAIDTLGAGDAFHGAFALAIAEGQLPTKAMRFGAATAALNAHVWWNFRDPHAGRSRGLPGGQNVFLK